VLEKTFDVSNDIDKAIKEVASLIYKETNGFISDMSENDIFDKIKTELKTSDFVSIPFEISGCTVAYNLINLGGELSVSSAFDLPPKSNITIGPFEIDFRLDSSYICLDTSKANDVIQLYLAMEGFANDIGEATSDETVKASEVLSFFENNKFHQDYDRVWSKKIKTSIGEISTRVKLTQDLSIPVNRHYLTITSATLALMEAQ